MSPNKADDDNRGPLLKAAERGHAEVIRLLTKAGASTRPRPAQRFEADPVMVAVNNTFWDCVSIMLPTATEESATGALEHAIYQGHDKMELFTERVPSAVLHYAAELGYEDLVKQLLDKGAQCQTLLNRGFTREHVSSSVLVGAICAGHLAIARQLIDRGADVNARYNFTNSTYALATAADRGDAEMVSVLLEHGADVNACGCSGPALQIAAYRGYMNIVRDLIVHGASLQDGRGSFGGPVQAAVLGGHVDILDVVVAAGVSPNMVVDVSRCGDAEVKRSGSPLQAAVLSSQPAMVDWLLRHSAVPMICGKDSSGTTKSPLSITAEVGDVHIIDKLLDAGANPNQDCDLTGPRPPLYWAVEKGHVDALKRLIAAGANPNLLVDYQGESITLLTKTCIGKNAEVVAALLAAGVDVPRYNDKKSDEYPPLHIAARYGTAEIFNVLVEHGAPIDEQADEGFTAIHVAADYGNQAILRALVFNHNVDPNLESPDGYRPIHLAAADGHTGCVSLLVHAGVDINVRDKSGQTALHSAAEYGHTDTVQFLLDHSADTSLLDHEMNRTAEEFAQYRDENTESEREDKEKILLLFKDSKVTSEAT